MSSNLSFLIFTFVTLKRIQRILYLARFSQFANFYLRIRFSTNIAEYCDWIDILAHAIRAMKAFFSPCIETFKMKPMRTMCTSIIGLRKANGALEFFIIIKLICAVFKHELNLCAVNLIKRKSILSLDGDDIMT